MSLQGNIVFSDQYDHRIRKVTVSTGIITTIAGIGTDSYSGDGGAATSATFNYPMGIALDASGIPHSIQRDSSLLMLSLLGNVYIADTGNNRVRKVTTSTGIISTIVGTGTGSYSGDNGAATAATLYGPTGVTIDATGTPQD